MSVLSVVPIYNYRFNAANEERGAIFVHYLNQFSWTIALQPYFIAFLYLYKLAGHRKTYTNYYIRVYTTHKTSVIYLLSVLLVPFKI